MHQPLTQGFTNTTDPRFTTWRKSPASGPNDGCLYLAPATDGSGLVAVADSKAGPAGPIQVYNQTELRAFLAGAKSGAFDYLLQD